ncbi:uncharacterized protein TNCV_3243711 [Trichonephila clavipes]|nr:uncharacterized protein TNCV_3243711 [Trichonephila clavipes]
MQRAVIAAFYHCCSGKSNPMHGQCPLGSESWCTYQRAQSAGKVFYDKNAGLPKSIINKLSRHIFSYVIKIFEEMPSLEDSECK